MDVTDSDSELSQRLYGLVQGELRGSLTDHDWSGYLELFADELESVGTYYDSTEVDEDLSDLSARIVRHYRRGRSAGPAHSESRPTGTTDALRAFEVARSVYLAHLISEQDDRVVGFRRDNLPASLLHHDDVVEWVEDHGGRLTEGRTSDDVVSWFAPGVEGEVADPDDPGWRSRRTGFRFADPCGSAVLERLGRLSRSLVADYGMQNASIAATFVLTGAWPLVPMLEARYTWDERPWLNRIHIEVHPDVPAKEVTAIYRATQRQFLADGERPHLQPVRSSQALVVSCTHAGPTRQMQAMVDLDPDAETIDRRSFDRTVARAKVRAMPAGGPADITRVRTELSRERAFRRTGGASELSE